MRVCSFYYIKWRHLVNLLPLDNAVLKLKHNGLLTLILTCATANDLNLVDYSVWGVLQEMVYHCSSFKSVHCAYYQKMHLSQRDNNSHNYFSTAVSVNGDWRRRLDNIVQCNDGHIKHVSNSKSTTLVLRSCYAAVLVIINFHQVAPLYKITILNMLIGMLHIGLDVCKKHVNIFGSFLDIRESVQWPRLFWPTRYTVITQS